MKHFITAMVIITAMIFVYGFMAKDRLRLSVIKKDKGQPFTLVVSMADQDERYHTLYVLACSAEMLETGVYCVDGGWQATSARVIQRKVESLPYLGLPNGTLMFAAVAMDRDGKNLASDRLTLLRAW